MCENTVGTTAANLFLPGAKSIHTQKWHVYTRSGAIQKGGLPNNQQTAFIAFKI